MLSMKNSKILVKTLLFLGVFVANSVYSAGLGWEKENETVFFSETINKPIDSNMWMLELVEEGNIYNYNAAYNWNKIKLNTVLVAIALGPFGVHRLYLGTDAKVPVVYTLTLGGGLGILPLIDVIAVLTAQDISQYQNNNKIVMWAK